MKHTYIGLAALLLTATSAFADNPPAAAASATPSAAQSSTTAASPSADDLKKAHDAQEKFLRANGWKPQDRNGVQVYCKSEAQTGSNFAVTTCAGGDVLEATLRLDKINRDTAPRIMNQGTLVH